MHSANVLQIYRRPKLRAWLGVVAVLLLLVAQTFATTHRLDSAAHANGDPCAICVSVASLGAGATAQVVEFGVELVRPLLAVVERPVFVSPARIRPSARGPPVASLTF
jgi:hypothetical protein